MERIEPKNVTIKIRTENRGPKIVTILFNLPNNPTYFEDLTKKLKARCGCGGTFKEGQVEIQGDQVTKISAILESIGFKIVAAKIGR